LKLSRKKLLKGCIYPKKIEQLLIETEHVLKTWTPIWTSFLSAPVQEEIKNVFKEIADISYSSNGGYPNAERKRILLQRQQNETFLNDENVPIKAIKIEGNFLFDRTEPEDFRQSIAETGVKAEEIGDLWITGDRGAQAMCTPEALKLLQNNQGFIRDVEIKYKSIDLTDLRIPFQRNPKKITSVEASKRLDAIASAGFGISRAKIISQIREGRVRLNWHTINNASRALTIGDRVDLEGKGSIEVLNLEITKKDRWRVELIRK